MTSDGDVANEAARTDALDRRIARAVALGVPVITFVGAAVIGATTGAASAVLVLVGGALLTVISFFWASLRTLSGEAPLPRDLAEALAERHAGSEDIERKRRAMRALKDLEHERAVGKIDADDYATLAATLRNEAKAAMRAVDDAVAPERERAEKVAEDYLRKRGLRAPSVAPPAADTSAATESLRVPCATCGTSNETDATFCKACGAAIRKGPDAT